MLVARCIPSQLRLRIETKEINPPNRVAATVATTPKDASNFWGVLFSLWLTTNNIPDNAAPATVPIGAIIEYQRYAAINNPEKQNGRSHRRVVGSTAEIFK
jgi:hypothetical protein